MEKRQENSKKRVTRFIIGIILIFISIVYGWVGLFLCNAIALKRGRHWVYAGGIIYGLSWLTYGLGFILAGKEGIIFVKNLFKRIFRCGK